MRGRHDVGARVGEWTLVRAIGEGGMASVFEATGPRDARAAVKILAPELAEERTTCARFLREGYIANEIDHPGVVRVMGDGRTDDGAPFLVMELLDGETLEDRRVRKGGRLPVDEVLWEADELLAILTAAHARGVVHRDVKPENVFLTLDGRIKLIDFGVARLLDPDATAMTRMGTVLGTLAYMAPEQARGSTDEVGVASDVWGVGATMFTLLSGRLLREDATVRGLLEAARQAVVSLASVAPDVPPSVVSLVDAALSFDPAVRWPSAVTMRHVVRMTGAELAHKEQRATDGMPTSGGSFQELRVRPSMQPPRLDPPASTVALSSMQPPPLTSRPPREPPARAPNQAWKLVALAIVIGLMATGAWLAR